MLSIAEAKGVEALHARHLGSRYRPGQRSPLWVRVPVPRIGRVLVGGWTPVDPRRPDRIASLLVGVPDGRGLRYVGRVGVSGEERRPVAGLRQLRRAESPFVHGVPAEVARDAIWVEPRVAGLVDHTGFTADGRLRLPHWRGTAGCGVGRHPVGAPRGPAGRRLPADDHRVARWGWRDGYGLGSRGHRFWRSRTGGAGRGERPGPSTRGGRPAGGSRPRRSGGSAR